MKLKIITPPVGRYSTAGPSISVGTTGGFFISVKGLEKMEFENKQRCSLLQDEESLGDWYIKVNPEGAHLASKNSKGTSSFSSAFIKKMIYDHFGHSGKKALKFNIEDAIVWPEGGGKVFPLKLIKESLDFVMPKDKDTYRFNKK